jgi:hypothetical protein
MDDNWRNKNIYEKLLYVSAELSKGGIKQSGDAGFESEKTGKYVNVKYVRRKDYLQRALMLGEKVGLYWFSNPNVEKNLLTTIAVNVSNPEEKLEVQNRTLTPSGSVPSKIMQNDGLIQSYGIRRNEYKIFNIIESDALEDLAEELKDDDDASQQKDLLVPITEKTKAELIQLLGQCDSNDNRVKDIASKDLSKMNEGWAVFAVKTLKNILEEKEDVPYDNSESAVVEVAKQPTPEQLDELRGLFKECKTKGLCSDVINELKRGVVITYEKYEEYVREMQEALNEQNR